jgi:hypothetical protein
MNVQTEISALVSDLDDLRTVYGGRLHPKALVILDDVVTKLSRIERKVNRLEREAKFGRQLLNK